MDTCLKQSNICPLGATVFLIRLCHLVVAKREIVFSIQDNGACVCVYVCWSVWSKDSYFWCNSHTIHLLRDTWNIKKNKSLSCLQGTHSQDLCYTQQQSSVNILIIIHCTSLISNAREPLVTTSYTLASKLDSVKHFHHRRKFYWTALIYRGKAVTYVDKV